jgi:hypothetical protein
MKMASRLSCDVPVLPKVGRRSAAARPVPSFAAAESRSSSMVKVWSSNLCLLLQNRSNQLLRTSGRPRALIG